MICYHPRLIRGMKLQNPWNLPVTLYAGLRPTANKLMDICYECAHPLMTLCAQVLLVASSPGLDVPQDAVEDEMTSDALRWQQQALGWRVYALA